MEIEASLYEAEIAYLIEWSNFNDEEALVRKRFEICMENIRNIRLRRFRRFLRLRRERHRLALLNQQHEMINN